MKKFILGIIIGTIISSGIVLAAQRITLEDDDGIEFGTSTNPIIIQF